MYGTDRQHLLTSMWSDHLVERPENEMTGVELFSWRVPPHRQGGGGGRRRLHGLSTEHWVFDGTDAIYGDVIGACR